VKTETEIADEQAGFQQGRGTIPNHVSKNTDAQARQHQQPFHMSFALMISSV